MEIETPLILSGLSKFLKPLIYVAIVAYAWMAVSNAAGPAAACALTALIAGPLTIKAVVRWINYRDTRQRLSDPLPPEGQSRFP